MAGTMTGLGLAFPVPGVGPDALPHLIRTACSHGFRSVWAGESQVADAFAVLATAAAVAPELGVGTAVVPAFTRAPGLLAVSAATLAGLAPGRTSIGVGASSVAVVERWGGVPYERPFARTRDVLRFLSRALSGQRITAEYETFSVDGFRLAQPPAVPPRLLVAALRPRMLRLAADEADGVVVTWVSPEDVRAMAAYLPDTHTVVACVPVCVSSDAGAVRDRMRPVVAEYLTTAGYAAAQQWLGRADALRPVWDAWQEGRRGDAVAAVSDELVDQFVVHGTPGRCRERLEQYRAAGVSDLALSLVALDHDPVETLTLLAGG